MPSYERANDLCVFNEMRPHPGDEGRGVLPDA